MKQELIVVIGAYGSGKSEYSINLAAEYLRKGFAVSLADLDVVNPYFRSRDVKDYFTSIGIDVICPEGEYRFADLPMISPRIHGAVKNKNRTVILDVGGDPAGCRALARFVPDIIERGYQMHFVVNTRRPFTSGKEEIIEMMEMLETSSKLKISEIISNSNLLADTSSEIIETGINIADQVAVEKNINFSTYLLLEDNAEKFKHIKSNKKQMILKYYLKKPWESFQ